MNAKSLCVITPPHIRSSNCIDLLLEVLSSTAGICQGGGQIGSVDS